MVFKYSTPIDIHDLHDFVEIVSLLFVIRNSLVINRLDTKVQKEVSKLLSIHGMANNGSSD